MNAVLRERLVNQKLDGSELSDPTRIVAWFGAMQAQDFPGAKWAVGLRSKTLTDAAVERAFNAGSILRTHVLRPTWHFVTRADIRWLVALTGPRIIARLAYRYRQLELDQRTRSRSRVAISRALANSPLTRRELGDVLRRARIAVTPERLSHLLMLAELEGVVCSGPLRDRQFTYALIDQRAARTPAIDREQALGMLAERYFVSHGPAAVADFAWWSGLPLRDAKSAIEVAGSALSRDALVSHTHRSARPRSGMGFGRKLSAWLLPNFDEYLVAYKDRSAVLGNHPVHPRDVLTNTVIIGGLAVAAWRVGREGDSLSIAVLPRRPLSSGDSDRIAAAVRRYSAFLRRPVRVRGGAGRAGGS